MILNYIKLTTAVFFFSISLTFGEMLPSNAKNEDFNDFTGGLNTAKLSYKLDKKYSPDMQNVDIDSRDGGIEKFRGFTVIGATNTLEKVNFIFEFRKENGNKEYIVSDSSLVLTTPDFRSWTLLRSGLNSNYLLDAAQVRNKVWLTNGTDNVFTYDGSTVNVLDGTTYGGTFITNAPKCKYIEFYQERVFLLNEFNDSAIVYYTDIISTNGVLISPDSYLAFHPENEFHVGQGDGDKGTAMWIYRGKLFFGKERSIYSLYGTNKHDYFANRTDSKVGISHNDGVVTMDNFCYIKSKKEGIYIFDGSSAERISDEIEDNMNALESNESNVIQTVYDTDEDFKKGTYSPMGSTYKDNTIIPYSTITANTYTAFKGILINPTSTSTKFITISTENVPANYNFNISVSRIRTTSDDTIPCAVGQASFKYYIKNEQTNEVFTTSITGNGQIDDPIGGFGYYYYDIFPNVQFTLDQIYAGKLSYKVEISTIGEETCDPFPTVNVGSIGFVTASDIILNNTTGAYVSDITTITTLSNWDNFNAFDTKNGGNISYSYRTSTSIVGISTEVFKPINSGTPINEPSGDKFFQWGATITGVTIHSIPNIDKVVILHNEGGSNDSRPIFSNWKNRLWISGSTNSANSTSHLIYVKSKNTSGNPRGFSMINGINIKSMLNTLDYFYAGSSTAGVIYRLDEGLRFNDLPIHAYYETPDMIFGSNFFKKEIKKYYLDCEKEDGNTLRIGTSVNGGDFSYNDIDLSGSGRMLRSINNVDKFGKYFRFRFENNQLDKDLKLNTFQVIYLQTLID